ncbi:MAG TPA: adenylyltransferase/cytidyltransferase family protein [Bacteroidales bacterium]|nr:adenylyltransferase/cytidyltransferase family protein [Bacteroidales bacterium]
MRIFRSFDEAAVIRNPVVTTGSFDGVHIGHKTILNRLKMLAEKYDGESALITFDPHPRKVLYPDTAGKDLKLINSQEEKLMMLSKAGLDNVIIVKFDIEFSRITSEQFVRDLLHNKLHARVIVAGFNHHFGFNKEGDYKQLWNWRELYNFEAEEIPEQEVYHETVSSTRIRQAINEGYIQRANAYLDHYYVIMGSSEKFIPPVDSGLPSLLKIRVVEESKLIPPSGVYAASIEEGNVCRKGMILICRKNYETPQILADVMDGNDIDPGSKLTLYFHKRIIGSVCLSDEKSIPKIKHAREEIAELIF